MIYVKVDLWTCDRGLKIVEVDDAQDKSQFIGYFLV